MGVFSKIKNRQLKHQIHSNGVALALGGGGFKGFFHVGVLEALDLMNIPVNFIAGTSVGALVGAGLACGLSISKIKSIALDMTKNTIFELGNPAFSKNGLLKGDKAQKFFDDILNKSKFEDTKIPFYVVATDLINGNKVIFNKGNIAKAIRASISIPAVFEPVIYGNQVLVDGGVVENLPMATVRKYSKLPLLASSLDTIYKTTDIELKKNENIANFIAKFLPIFDMLPGIKKEEHKYLDSNMASILFRAWNIMSCEKLQYELKENKPDIFVSIDADTNPGMEDLNKYNILSIIDQGKNTTLKTLNNMGIIE